LKIRLNGETAEIPGPLTIAALLARLEIDARRVAVEHNLAVVKRAAYDTTTVGEGDEIEIVNFVGGGARLRSEGASARQAAESRVPNHESRVPR